MDIADVRSQNVGFGFRNTCREFDNMISPNTAVRRFLFWIESRSESGVKSMSIRAATRLDMTQYDSVMSETYFYCIECNEGGISHSQ